MIQIWLEMLRKIASTLANMAGEDISFFQIPFNDCVLLNELMGNLTTNEASLTGKSLAFSVAAVHFPHE